MATTSVVSLINYYDIVVNSYILRLIDVEVSEFGRGRRLTHVCVGCGLWFVQMQPELDVVRDFL